MKEALKKFARSFIEQNRDLFNFRKEINSSRLDFFDGLRGWASVIVLFWHLYNTFPDGGRIPYSVTLFSFRLALFPNGPFAVYVFFVLSGTVLSLKLIQKKDLSVACGLALKRIPRLGIPIFFSTLITVILLRYGLMFNQELGAIYGGNDYLDLQYTEIETITLKKIIWFSFFSVFNGEISYNIALWTMVGELAGSFFLIPLLVCYKFIKPRYIIPVFIVFFLYFIKYKSPDSNAVLFCFTLGMCISYLYVEKRRFLDIIRKNPAIQAALVTGYVIVYFIFKTTKVQSVMSLLAFALVFILISTPFLQKFFSLAISRFLGKISFPLYITHIAVLNSLSCFMIIHNGARGSILIGVVAVAASIAAAVLFYPAEALSIVAPNFVCKYIIVKEKSDG